MAKLRAVARSAVLRRMFSRRRRLRLALAIVLALPGAFLHGQLVYASGITEVQAGPLATPSNTSSVTATFASSAGGTLLVAQVSHWSTDNNLFSGPSGWSRAVHAYDSDGGELEIWYYPDAPAGLTSAKFTTVNTYGGEVADVTEWSGVAATNPLDQAGPKSCSTNVFSCTVSTTGAVSVSGELGITNWGMNQDSGPFTPGAGWSAVFSDSSDGWAGDSDPDLGSGTISETEQSSSQTRWAGAIATFLPTSASCTGGSLGLTSSATVTYTSTPVSATATTATSTILLQPDDETGSGAGWNITASTTSFTNGKQTLPMPAITGVASATAGSGNCSMPTNTVAGYPITLSGSPSKVYDASAGTGAGPANITMNTGIVVPGGETTGTYTATMTFAISSGP